MQSLKYSRDSLDTNIGMCFKNNSYITDSRPVPTVLPLSFFFFTYKIYLGDCCLLAHIARYT